MKLSDLAPVWPDARDLSDDVVEQIETDCRYAPYLARQAAEVEAFRREAALGLPDDLDYRAIGGLSAEAREKLELARPANLAAAARIPGLTPASLTALLVHVRGRSKSNEAEIVDA